MATLRRLLLATTLLAAVLTLAPGCTSTTSIGDLLADPGRYDHKTVRISGTVRETIGALGYGAYRVDDGSGTLLVVSERGGAPTTGASVGVEGEFRSAYTVGTQTGAVLIERRRTG